MDLVFISIILAAVHRNTGLTFDTSALSSIDVRRWFSKYLDLGETCYEYVVYFLSRSGYFRQRNILRDRVTEEANNIMKSYTREDSHPR